MTRYRTQSAEVLNSADSFEDRLNYMLFCQDQAATQWADDGGWHPGDPIWGDPRWTGHMDRQHVRPMYQMLQVVPGSETRCTDCEVSWDGEEPCWNCGVVIPEDYTRWEDWDSRFHWWADDRTDEERQADEDHWLQRGVQHPGFPPMSFLTPLVPISSHRVQINPGPIQEYRPDLRLMEIVISDEFTESLRNATERVYAAFYGMTHSFRHVSRNFNMSDWMPESYRPRVVVDESDEIIQCREDFGGVTMFTDFEGRTHMGVDPARPRSPFTQEQIDAALEPDHPPLVLQPVHIEAINYRQANPPMRPGSEPLTHLRREY